MKSIVTRARKAAPEAAGLLMFVLVLLSARSSLADHYHVPTGSMQPTVAIGDRVLVDKMAYGLRAPFGGVELVGSEGPAVGDVVVLDSPEDGVTLLKRVVATPGTVSMPPTRNEPASASAAITPRRTLGSLSVRSSCSPRTSAASPSPNTAQAVEPAHSDAAIQTAATATPPVRGMGRPFGAMTPASTDQGRREAAKATPVVKIAVTMQIRSTAAGCRFGGLASRGRAT